MFLCSTTKTQTLRDVRKSTKEMHSVWTSFAHKPKFEMHAYTDIIWNSQSSSCNCVLLCHQHQHLRCWWWADRFQLTYSKMQHNSFNSHTILNENRIQWNQNNTEFRSSRHIKLNLNGVFRFSRHWTHSFWTLCTWTVNTTANAFVFVSTFSFLISLVISAETNVIVHHFIFSHDM